MTNIYEPALYRERVILLKYSQSKYNTHKFATFLIRFPKILLAELNTHRQLVRNCGSSRAIPSKTFIDSILNDPYIPPFSQNRPGMTGLALDKTDKLYEEAEENWLEARDSMIEFVDTFEDLGIHKQDANRLLESFYHVDLVLSGTDWANFIKLRTAPDAQPAFREIALKIESLLTNTKPDLLDNDEWHIPFMEVHQDTERLSLEDKLKVAIARIARVSYSSHGSDKYDIDADLKLADRLMDSGHYSPLEHVARCIGTTPKADNPDMKYLDPKLYNSLFWDSSSNIYRWTRQYQGFYTFRHHKEDSVIIQ